MPTTEKSNPPSRGGEIAKMAGKIYEVLSCCSAPVRLEIIAHLVRHPMCVKELSRELQLDHTLVSKYLKILTFGRIPEMRRDKTRHVFSVARAVGVREVGELVEIDIPVRGGPTFRLMMHRPLLHEPASHGQAKTKGVGDLASSSAEGPSGMRAVKLHGNNDGRQRDPSQVPRSVQADEGAAVVHVRASRSPKGVSKARIVD